MDGKDAVNTGAAAAGGAFGGPIGALAAGAGASLVTNGIQAMFANDEQKAYERNMRQNYKYGQMSQVNSARNMVEGYKLAGLSPALAAGANFSPAPMQSAPLQNKSAMPIDVAGALRAGKELELADSQKFNLDEQTRQLKIKNDREQQADANYNSMMVNTVERWMKQSQDPVLRSVYQDLLENPEQWNKGTFDALRDITDFSAFIKESYARASEADIKRLVADMQRMGGVYKAMAQMPAEELQLLYKEANLKRALAMNAYAQAKTQGEEQKRLQKEQTLLEEKARNVAEETRKMRFGKYGNMYDHGDYSAAMAEILGNAAEHTAKVVGEEGAKLGADIIRAKTGTPHGMVRTETKHTQTGSRGAYRESWTDTRGHKHERYEEDAFPRQE